MKGVIVTPPSELAIPVSQSSPDKGPRKPPRASEYHISKLTVYLSKLNIWRKSGSMKNVEFANVACGSSTDLGARLSQVRSSLNCRHAGTAAAGPFCANNRSGQPYSITSSARASTDGRTVRPRGLAVLRLMTRSNLVGCTMRLKAQAASVVIPLRGISGVEIPADSLACRLDRRHPRVAGKTAGNG